MEKCVKYMNNKIFHEKKIYIWIDLITFFPFSASENTTSYLNKHTAEGQTSYINWEQH